MKAKSMVSFVAITLLLMGVMVVPAASAKPPGGNFSLRIFCFYDANGNGKYDGAVDWGENVQNGWHLKVTHGSDVIFNGVTDCSGVVLLTGLPMGWYTVTQYAGIDCGCGCIEYSTTMRKLLSYGGNPNDYLSQTVKVVGDTNLLIGNLCFCPLDMGHTIEYWSTSDLITNEYVKELNKLNLYDPVTPARHVKFSGPDDVRAYLTIGDSCLKYRLSAQLVAFTLDDLHTFEFSHEAADWDSVQPWTIMNVGPDYYHPVLRDCSAIIRLAHSALMGCNKEIQNHWLDILYKIGTNDPSVRMVSWYSCWGPWPWMIEGECPM